MKRIKLLPLVGVSAICAVVAPIMLTSCNSNKMVNLMEKYNPTIERAKAFTEEQSTKQLTEWYYNAASSNHEIFKQDFYYAHNLYISYLNQKQIIEMESASAKISNISISTITSSGGETVPSLSCDIQYNYKGKPGQESGIEKAYINPVFEGSFTFKFTNVPMKLYFYNDDTFIKGWANQILVEKDSTTEEYTIPAAFDNLWTITEDAKVIVTDEGTTEGIYFKHVYPFFTKTSASTKENFLKNLVGQEPITKLTLTDIATSYYMSALGAKGQ